MKSAVRTHSILYDIYYDTVDLCSYTSFEVANSFAIMVTALVMSDCIQSRV